MERYEGKSGLNYLQNQINKAEKKKKAFKVISFIVFSICVYFTITLYDWKLAVLIIAYMWANNMEQTSKRL